MTVNAAGTQPTWSATGTAPSDDVSGDAVRWAAACCFATIVLGGAAEWAGATTRAQVAAAAGLQALFLSFALARLQSEGLPRFGVCNRITLARTSIVATFAALSGSPPSDALVLWFLVLIAVAALVLDGLDGAAARRDGDESSFGAWLDQETDALFVAVLSVFVWRSGEAGPWILLAGGWRYLFLGLARLAPRLRGELPASQRRRVVCVVQLSVLVGCVSPLVEAPLSTGLAAASLALLTWSFGADLVQLWTTSSRPESGRASRGKVATPSTPER